MNLHLIPDDKFTDSFIDRIESLHIVGSNVFVVRSKKPFLFIKKHSLEAAKLNSPEFHILVGNLEMFDRIFVHFMDEECVDFIVKNPLKEVIWMPWGADIYESLYGSVHFLDDNTEKLLGITILNRLNQFVYKSFEKALKRNKYFRAYSKVSGIATWIPQEFEFARHHLPGFKARQYFFFYDLDTPFAKLQEKILHGNSNERREVSIMIGHSGNPVNNHVSALLAVYQSDFVNRIDRVGIPASYGSSNYVNLLRSWVDGQHFPFVVDFHLLHQPYDKYVEYVNAFDVIILNSIRPAGLGNFWLGIFLGKTIFLNSKNLAFPFLKNLGLSFYSLDEINAFEGLAAHVIDKNREICLEFFSEKKYKTIYYSLFH